VEEKEESICKIEKLKLTRKEYEKEKYSMI